MSSVVPATASLPAVPPLAGGRPRRRDAELNHARVLAAAREVLAREGVDASMEAIARRAGVGVGTLYRHFPDKAALISAVLDDGIDELLALAREALRADDPWQGFADYVERAIEAHARNRCLREVVAGTADGLERVRAMRSRLRPLHRRIVVRAQEAGVLRADVAAEDVPMLFWACDRAIEAGGDVAPDAWRRLLALLLDGLRAPGGAPLPVPPLTHAELDRIAPAGRSR